MHLGLRDSKKQHNTYGLLTSVSTIENQVVAAHEEQVEAQKRSRRWHNLIIVGRPPEW